MQIPVGNSMRVVVAGPSRPRKRYATNSVGVREAVGVEVDENGTPLSGFVATVASPTVGWTESALIVAPAPLLEALSTEGTVVELSGNLMLSVRGGDFGTTRATVTGVVGLKSIGSVIDVVGAMSAPSERSAR